MAVNPIQSRLTNAIYGSQLGSFSSSWISRLYREVEELQASITTLATTSASATKESLNKLEKQVEENVERALRLRLGGGCMHGADHGPTCCLCFEAKGRLVGKYLGFEDGLDVADYCYQQLRSRHRQEFTNEQFQKWLRELDRVSSVLTEVDNTLKEAREDLRRFQKMAVLLRSKQVITSESTNVNAIRNDCKWLAQKLRTEDNDSSSMSGVRRELNEQNREAFNITVQVDFYKVPFRVFLFQKPTEQPESNNFLTEPIAITVKHDSIAELIVYIEEALLKYIAVKYTLLTLVAKDSASEREEVAQAQDSLSSFLAKYSHFECKDFKVGGAVKVSTVYSRLRMSPHLICVNSRVDDQDSAKLIEVAFHDKIGKELCRLDEEWETGVSTISLDFSNLSLKPSHGIPLLIALACKRQGAKSFVSKTSLACDLSGNCLMNASFLTLLARVLQTSLPISSLDLGYNLDVSVPCSDSGCISASFEIVLKSLIQYHDTSLQQLSLNCFTLGQGGREVEENVLKALVALIRKSTVLRSLCLLDCIPSGYQGSGHDLQRQGSSYVQIEEACRQSMSLKHWEMEAHSDRSVAH